MDAKHQSKVLDIKYLEQLFEGYKTEKNQFTRCVMNT